MKSRLVIDTAKLKKHKLEINGYVFLTLLEAEMFTSTHVYAEKFKRIAEGGRAKRVGVYCDIQSYKSKASIRADSYNSEDAK